MANDEQGVMRDSLGVELGEGDRVLWIGSFLEYVGYVVRPATLGDDIEVVLDEGVNRHRTIRSGNLVRMEACEDAYATRQRWGRAQ